MKALTLTQPWASMVAIGAKRIETRSWSTRYRGPLAIHAAKGFPRFAQEFANSGVVLHSMKSALLFSRQLRTFFTESGKWSFNPRGVVLATCELTTVARTESLKIGDLVGGVELTELEYALGDYSPGRFAWVLSGLRILEAPVQARGSLSLWEWKQ